MVTWQGVYPAVLTFFTDEGRLDLDQFMVNIRAQQEAGVDAIIIGGSLGEASTISLDEKIRMMQACRSEFGDSLPVLINVAESNLDSALRVVRMAEEAGADGLMALPPMQYKATDAEVVWWFEQIADHTGLPIMLYNNPVDYKIEIKPDMFEPLLKKENIQAVKESTRDVSNVTRLKHRYGDRLKVLGGVDTLAMECLVMGADGWVAGLVDAFPAETVAIYRLVKAGRIAEAQAIYRWFMPVLELDINPQLVQNIKLAAVHTGIGSENVRPPRRKLEGDERKRVEMIIKEGLQHRPTLPDYLNM